MKLRYILIILSLCHAEFSSGSHEIPVSVGNDINDSLSEIEANLVNQESEDIKSDTDKYIKKTSGKAIILNKITAKSEEVIFSIGKAKIFGKLSITLHQCLKSTDLYRSNSLMLFTIDDHKQNNSSTTERIFSGWMISDNLSISTLEHPVYEIIPVDCL